MSIELQAQAKSRILIVDDSGMNRMMLSELLEDRYDILEASNGVEALALIRQNLSSLDLVLLDIVMPELDGFGVLAHMKKCHWLEFIPVIMISSEGDSSYIEKAFNLGASDYIQRPYKGFLIHRRIMNTLGLFQRQRRLVGLVEEQVYENEKNSRMMINVLGHIVEFRNGESGMHIHHIQVITKLLLHHLVEMTDAYPLSESDIAMYSTASALHDIGKISIDGDILNKPGRLTPEEMTALLQGADLCVDATHPYAVEATRNIRAACKTAGTEYRRLLRPEGGEEGLRVDSPEEAARLLAGREGNILLATGA